MNILVWVKSKKVFLKIQEGTGDNLQREDRAEGYVDYVLWSTFRPSELGIDSLLEMECVASGMVMDKEYLTGESSLPACYADAFDIPFDKEDVLLLFTDDDVATIADKEDA